MYTPDGYKKHNSIVTKMTFSSCRKQYIIFRHLSEFCQNHSELCWKYLELLVIWFQWDLVQMALKRDPSKTDTFSHVLSLSVSKLALYSWCASPGSCETAVYFHLVPINFEILPKHCGDDTVGFTAVSYFLFNKIHGVLHRNFQLIVFLSINAVLHNSGLNSWLQWTALGR